MRLRSRSSRSRRLRRSPRRADASASTDDTDLTPIASYEFDFGDGSPPVVTTAPTATATHAYAAAGTYTVSVIASDTGANASAPATANITVDESIPGSADARPLASADDAEQTGTTVGLSSSDLELVEDGSSNQTVGIRWPGLAHPAGRHDHRRLRSSSSPRKRRAGATNLVIQGQAADNAAAFATGASPSSRPRTTASVNWSPVPWTRGEAGANQRTPDLKTVIQEIVSRPGWASGNALAMIITGTGRRTAWAFNGGASLAPLLHVEYLVGPPPPNYPPVAQLSVSQLPSPFLTVRADAAGSIDDGDLHPIASYQFDFGDGSRASDDPGARPRPRITPTPAPAPIP